MSHEKIKEEVIKVCRKMVDSGLVVAKQGNISVKISDNKIIVTPSKLSYERMTVSDLLILDIDGSLIEGIRKPSKETPMHLAIYKARNDVRAIIHTHSPYATAISALHETIPVFLEEQVPYLGGEISTAEYAPSGTKELANNVVNALGSKNATLLANHGVVACGANLEQAYKNAQLVERIAQIYVISRGLGKIWLIPEKFILQQKLDYQKK